MKRFSLLFLIFVGIAALLIGTAQVGEATLMMRLDDVSTAGIDVQISDTDLDGVLSFSGPVGAFAVNFTTGLSKPLIGGPQLARVDLNSVNVSGAAGQLLIAISDTGFILSNQDLIGVNLTNAWGGTTDGTVSAWGALAPNNVAFDGGFSTGMQGPLGPGAFAGTVTTAIAAGALSAGQMFSLTESVQILHTTAGQVTSFDKSLTAAVPEPSTLLLLGSGLLGLAGIRRRKFRK